MKELNRNITVQQYFLENDTVDFLIKQINIVDGDRGKRISIGNIIIYERETFVNGFPYFELEILIKNKTNNYLSIITNSSISFDSDFIGILKNNEDTICFYNDFLNDKYMYIAPRTDTTIILNSNWFKSLEYNVKLDNTHLMLEILKNIKFYYLPMPKYVSDNDSDTIKLYKKYRLGISDETKIYSIIENNLKTHNHL
jgi:hypothetical protein